MATTVSQYTTIINGDSQTEAEAEAAQLEREGFQEGGQELITSSKHEAVSVALVFRTARGAEQEFRRNISEDIKIHHRLKRFTVATIPNSVGFAQEATANAFFTTGRCFLLVGDAVTAAPSDVRRAPIVGAQALYRRAKRLCS